MISTKNYNPLLAKQGDGFAQLELKGISCTLDNFYFLDHDETSVG